MGKEEHVYYWAWQEVDNPDHKYFSPESPKWYRVFRRMQAIHDEPVTEAMPKEEAINARLVH